jgi:transcriptional regulator with XRE-family HTH domain
MMTEKNTTKLFKARLEKGYTQARLARLSGVSVHTICKLEQGALKIENAKLSTVTALAYTLGVSIWKLLDDWQMSEQLRRVST